MSAGFGDEFKEQVRAATDLVDLVSATVPLTANGRDYKGLCPFHDDRNPSFHVYSDRQTYRCWVCDLGGDCFTWVQEIEKVGFPEAVRILAERARLELPRTWRREWTVQQNQGKAGLIEVVEWAIGLMQQSLRIGPEGELARTYLKNRKISDDTIRSFRLGYHPEDWNWLLNQRQGRFSEKQLLDAGLAGERRDGSGCYDNLVGRLVFPIADERGRSVSFGGRVLPGGNIDSDTKYWNGTETGVFQKRRILYAFDKARETIRKTGMAIVVEGYMDCIACHQAGITNAVATLGTALTDDHARFLGRFAQRIVLNYDGDEAGQRAAERSVTRFLAHDLDLRVLTLAEGKDPADYLDGQSAEDFQALVATAPEAWEYKLRAVLLRNQTDSVHGKQQVLSEMLEFLTAAPGLAETVREDLILRRVCGLMQADERRVRRQLADLRTRRSARPAFRKEASHEPPRVTIPGSGAERELLEIIVSLPEHIHTVRHHVGPDDFEDARHRRLLELCFDLAEAGELPEFHRIVAAAESDSEIISLANSVLDSAQEKGISELMAEHSVDEHGSETVVPLHLERVLHPLLERRARYHTLRSKQKMAQTDSSSSNLNSDAKEALHRIYQFRQEQLGNQPPTFK